jgi:capsular exopolysaccharide synthesis family protein
MAEEKNREEKNRGDSNMDEALLIRPSGQPPLTSLDQIQYNYYSPAAPEEGFNVRDIWRKIRKRKWLILTIAAIATTIVSIESFRTKSIYQATTKVAFNRDRNAIVKLGDAVLGLDNSELLQTDLLLLQTYPLQEEVAVRLRLDQNSRFLDVGGRKSVIEAISTILARFKGGQRSEPSKVAAEIKPDETGSALQGVTRSREESERLAPFAETLMAYMKVEQIPETSAIQISFTHTDPELAAQVANGMSQVFVEFSFNNKTSKFNKSADWLTTMTRKLQAQVQQSEQELANYGQANNFYNSNDKGTFVDEKLASIYSQAMKAEYDRIVKQSLMEEVKQGRLTQLPEAFSDVRTGQLKTKLGELQIEAAQLGTRYGPEHPKVVEKDRQIAELQLLINDSSRSLKEKLQADYERALRDEALIKTSLDRAKSEAIQQNQASIKFNILKQNVDTAKALYNDFLQKTNQANISLAEQTNDLRIIEPARMGTLVGPQRMKAIGMGLMLSLIAGVGLALLLEYLDNTVKSVEDVARVTQLPTLALIPSMNVAAVRAIGSRRQAAKKAISGAASMTGEGQSQDEAAAAAAVGGIAPRSMHPQNDNKVATLESLSSIVEAYRMLRTSVLLSTAGTPPKTILVTSSQPGEGKTTTAVNMAISLAQIGSSVLIIDSDLRRPAVHKTFKIPNMKGITNYLSGRTAIENLIVKLPIQNLSVLPCGPVPPNPAELISSERMRDLLRLLGERYDHIIIDSPPLISVTDPVILSAMVDGSILVVHSGRSTRDLVRRARQELNSVGAKVFGVVLNNVDIKKEGYDDYYYYRYYSSYGEGQRGASAG